MLAAMSGLAYLLSTILKLENSLGYFLPLPVVISAMRAGPGAGWRTMMATSFLLLGKQAPDMQCPSFVQPSHSFCKQIKALKPSLTGSTLASALLYPRCLFLLTCCLFFVLLLGARPWFTEVCILTSC